MSKYEPPPQEDGMTPTEVALQMLRAAREGHEGFVRWTCPLRRFDIPVVPTTKLADLVPQVEEAFRALGRPMGQSDTEKV